MDFEQETLTRVVEARGAAVTAVPGRPRRRGAAGPGGELPDRSPAPAVRPGRELPRPEGQPERPPAPGGADHHREPDRLLAPALQQHRAGVQHLHPDLPERADRRDVRLPGARLLPDRGGRCGGARGEPAQRAAAGRSTRCAAARTADGQASDHSALTGTAR